MAGMKASPEDTQGVYDRQAATYDSQRARGLFEARWLARFAASVTPQGRILDLGCGAGEPIARWFKAEGFTVTGVDFSQAMLNIARERWPEGDWRLGDMRSFELEERFDGIIAWDSFFHLPPEDQRACIMRMAAHMAPGASLLLTVGPRGGEATGKVGGEAVYHASLSPAEYVLALEHAGLRLTGFLSEDPETDHHSVLMARKDKD